MISTTLKPYTSSPLRWCLAPSVRAGRNQNVEFNMTTRFGVIKAAIVSGNGDAKTIENTNINRLASITDANGAASPPPRIVRAVVTVRNKMKETLAENVEDQLQRLVNGIGQGISIQLISEEIDLDTQSGKSVESGVKGWLPNASTEDDVIEYGAEFTVPNDFGNPGAVIITNHHYKEFHLVRVVVHGFDTVPVSFPANSWIHSRNDNYDSRIIFKNHACLPSQTPAGLRDQRREDLLSLRGNGKGERKVCDRVYDYAPYNDLGSPDKDPNLSRPALGNEQMPYPRRCRTGRAPTESEPETESRAEMPVKFYVPRDERLKELKQNSNTNTSSTGGLKKVIDNLVPRITEFTATVTASISGKKAPNASDVPEDEAPPVIQSDKFAWLEDYIFARRTVAGNSPVIIEILKEFPIISNLDPKVYGPPDSALTKEVIGAQIQTMSVDQALAEKRLFILDHHDILLPFIERMNSNPGKKSYASRMVLFYTEIGTLKPVAIELSLPEGKHIYTPGHDAATSEYSWKLAKAHVCSNDGSVHQYVSHWMRTHAAAEPYIIATHRQLSSMHPIYKLLHPHMRYTLETSANTRQNLIQAGGMAEAVFSTGEIGMELSSAAYKTNWRFDMEGLPADLLRRGVAVEDPSATCGVKLLIEDYPYAADGLLIWSAIKEWVESYVAHFYHDSEEVKSDVELQAWWYEIKNKGHSEKRDELWWPSLDNKEDLSSVLTTIIWMVSGYHQAVSLGQNPAAGLIQRGVTFMRKLIPVQSDPDYENFQKEPHSFFLSALPPSAPASATKAAKVSEPPQLPDEDYLGGFDPMNGHWFSDPKVMEMSRRFSSQMEGIKDVINARNNNPNLKVRNVPGAPPYEALLPKSKDRGIPSSITI